MARRERRGIRARLEREIPAAVPALASPRHWLHVPDRRAARDLADANPGDVGGCFRQHVDVNDDLTIVRAIEIERRTDDIHIAGRYGGEGRKRRDTDQKKGGEGEKEPHSVCRVPPGRHAGAGGHVASLVRSTETPIVAGIRYDAATAENVNCRGETLCTINEATACRSFAPHTSVADADCPPPPTLPSRREN